MKVMTRAAILSFGLVCGLVPLDSARSAEAQTWESASPAHPGQYMVRVDRSDAEGRVYFSHQQVAKDGRVFMRERSFLADCRKNLTWSRFPEDPWGTPTKFGEDADADSVAGMLFRYVCDRVGRGPDDWNEAIKTGQVYAALMHVVRVLVARSELTISQSRSVEGMLGPAMTLTEGGRPFLAQRIVVAGPKGEPPHVDTYKFAELTGRPTLLGAARTILGNVLSDPRIADRLRSPR